VLGANFIERDAMTRRMQYRGNIDAEWASYGADTKAIATAFVRGINAWVALARDRPPEEFALARWKPDFWAPSDVLNRTDAFLASGDALDEISRRELSDFVADAVRRVGTAPFFAGLRTPPTDQTSVRNSSGAANLIGGVLHASAAATRLDHPSARYLVHLNAPGWNVIGAASPWLPGVAVGHNDRVAWAAVAINVDTEDIYIDDASAARKLEPQPILVKGRSTPLSGEAEATPHGVVIAADREHHLVYALRWSGFEPGAAAGLAALAIDRARTRDEFRHALERWKMPPRRIVYVDARGEGGYQDAALVPIRHGAEWNRWMTLDELPHGNAVAARWAQAVANGDPATGMTAIFAHVIATSQVTRQRFNVGPLTRPAADDSPTQFVLDPGDWDRSRAINAPGQSGWPGSAHFSDFARPWSAGELVPLVFSNAAVRANTEATLILQPK
jgi:penicillin amidase